MIIDKTLEGNSSVANLIKIINPHYRIFVGVANEPIDQYITRSPISDCDFYVGLVDDNTLGIWPEKGPVWELNCESNLMEIALEKGLLRKEKNYTHDDSAKAMILYRLSEDTSSLDFLKKEGLEHLSPGSEIRLYLEPQ